MSARVLFRHGECFVYRIPPQSFSSAGHHAESWGLQKPFITASIEVWEEPVKEASRSSATGGSGSGVGPAATKSRDAGEGGGNDDDDDDDDDGNDDLLSVCTIKMFKGKKLFAKCELDMDAAGEKGLPFYMQAVRSE